MNRIENLDYILRVLMREQEVHTALPGSLPEKQRLMRALMNTRPPWPASDEFLAAQDSELQMQMQEKGVVEVESGLWQGDITRLKVDAIVNAANSQMMGCWHPLHACIDNCIHSAAGIQLRDECHHLMQGSELPTGEARITKAYNLPCRYVIHTVGPIVSDGRPTPKQREQLADCYRNCLGLAEANGCRSIAFCCISTGVFGYPNREAAEVAIETVKTYNSTINVVFNVFKDNDYDIYRELLAKN